MTVCVRCNGEIVKRNAGMHRGVVTLAQEWVHVWPWHRHAPILPKRLRRQQ